MPDYGKLVEPLARRDDGRRPCRGRALQARSDGFRFVEALEGRASPAWDFAVRHQNAGRPGWHIECSAMSWKHLGETFDIHGGGIDLVFPHHENELAQTRCAFHSPSMASVWMHNGFLQVEGEKMSKSLGNFVTIRELLDRLAGRSAPLQYAAHALSAADRLDRGRVARKAHARSLVRRSRRDATSRRMLCAGCVSRRSRDDLNTPQAIADLHELQERRRGDSAERSVRPAPQGQRRIDGPVADDRRRMGRHGEPASLRDRCRRRNRRICIAARNAARKAKDFKEADRIRDELAGNGRGA